MRSVLQILEGVRNEVMDMTPHHNGKFSQFRGDVVD